MPVPAILAVGALAALAHLQRARLTTRGSRSAGDRQSPGAQGARQQGGRKPRVCPQRFDSPKNELAGMVFYHGSRGQIFDAFDSSESSTSHGMFFARDPDTAAFYGDNIYKVKLYAKKVADLDDPLVLRNILEGAFGGQPSLYIRGRYGDIREADRADTASWAAEALTERARSCPTSDAKVRGWLAGRVPGEDIEGYFGEIFLEELELDGFDSDHELWDALSDADKREFKRDFLEIDPDVVAAEEAYGTDGFYLNYQDSVLMMAENMGYDCVVFSDPSSSGEPVSHVVFSSSQVCILDVGRYEEVVE
jgi:hypothetical protein